jgi:imidazole glycerol phosphate synthase glutamine amidotransferase subunit
MKKHAELVIIETGVANLASVRALSERIGLEPIVSADPNLIAQAPFVILPGVGAFGPAMQKLSRAGLDDAIRIRVTSGLPTAGICLGMQLFFEASEESEGVRGLSIFEGTVTKLKTSLPLPQLGWNRILPESQTQLLHAGWVYFANSYGLTLPVPPETCVPRLKLDAAAASSESTIVCAKTEYGSSFISAIEVQQKNRPFLLLCQFHPELSGQFGTDLFSRWITCNFPGRNQ